MNYERGKKYVIETSAGTRTLIYRGCERMLNGYISHYYFEDKYGVHKIRPEIIISSRPL